MPKTVREQLAQGEWHMTGNKEFHPIRYDAQRIAIPGVATVTDKYEEQPLKFRLQVTPELAASRRPSKYHAYCAANRRLKFDRRRLQMQCQAHLFSASS